MMIELKCKNNKYGIIEDSKIVVPFTHIKLEEAINEWEYFERSNTNERQFLDYQRTNKEIDSIIIMLKN